jgi:hypothetical protein
LCENVRWAVSSCELRENKYVLFLFADALTYVIQIKGLLLNIRLIKYNDEFRRSLKFIANLMNGCVYFTEFSVRKESGFFFFFSVGPGG